MANLKKIVSIILILIIGIGIANYSLAANEYSFDLQYTGTVVKNEEKNANVLLIGQNGTLYSKVRIKVDINGPATPKIMATDSNDVEHNIAELGYWGPAEGFAVQGDFTNTTPIRATFPEAGKYTIKLSLINLTDGSVITTKSFEVDVISEEVPPANVISNEIVNNIEELPQTGTSIFEYIAYFSIIVIIFGVVGMYIYRKR